MKRIRILAAVLALALLCGCSGVLSSEYVSVKPHSEQHTVDTNDGALTAENYLSLKNDILSFVENGVEDGVIRIYDYSGSVEDDLAAATYDVSKSDPLGAYAVDYMTHECALIVSYYEAHIHITFRRSVAQIRAIQRVTGTAELCGQIYSAMDSYAAETTMRMSYYNDPDVPGLAEAYYDQNPSTCMEMPEVTVGVYPDSGYVRIIEVQFTYEDTPERLSEKKDAVATSVRAAKEYVRYRQTDAEKLQLLYTYLSERFRYRSADTSTPVYSFLCEGVTTSEGCAKSLQIICDSIGLECYTVSGQRDSEPYYWNIVGLDGAYYHADLARSLTDGGEKLALRKDSDMTEYFWNSSLYPACS